MTVVVVTVYIVLLTVLLIVFQGIIYDIHINGKNIIIIGDGGGVICGTVNVLITI